MIETTRRVEPSGPGRWRCVESGEWLDAPPGWALLPSGDAALTRRVKADGPHWMVEERRGRRVFSRGVLAPEGRIEHLRGALEQERASPGYTRRLAASRQRAQRAQESYVDAFRQAVLEFLASAPVHRPLAEALADVVAAHATPVGSGTVARTRRIPLERRAAAAVIAWMRHQTTDYDRLEIPRVRGRRREVRRRLARRSRQLLERLRRGERLDPETCPLHRALGLSGGAPSEPAPAPRPAPSPSAGPAPAPVAPAPPRPLWQAPLQAPRRR